MVLLNHGCSTGMPRSIIFRCNCIQAKFIKAFDYFSRLLFPLQFYTEVFEEDGIQCLKISSCLKVPNSKDVTIFLKYRPKPCGYLAKISIAAQTDMHSKINVINFHS